MVAWFVAIAVAGILGIVAAIEGPLANLTTGAIVVALS